MKQAISILMLVLMATIARGQDNDGERTPHHYEYVEINGVMVKKYVSDHKPSIDNDKRNEVRDAFRRLERAGFVAALNDLSLTSLGDISSSLELQDYQKKEVAKLLSEFREQSQDARTEADRQAVVVNFSAKLKDQLLPAQLGSLLSKRLFFSRITLTKLGEEIQLSDAQRKQLVAECGKINDDLAETIARLEKEQAEAKAKMRQIYESVLTEEQRSQLSNKLNAPRILSEMSLPEMERDTRFKK